MKPGATLREPRGQPSRLDPKGVSGPAFSAPFAVEPPELEDAAYHVHQAVEKVTKAILVAEGVKFPRGRGMGHDLDQLTKLIPVSNALRAQGQHMSDLTPWAIAFRYPADDPFTLQPLPTKPELERRLGEAETFLEAARRQIASTSGAS